MIVAALVGGVVLGFVDAKLLLGEIQKLFSDPGTQSVASAGVAAFLGVIWGWLAKSLLGSRPKE
jgi:hypothetical protein